MPGRLHFNGVLEWPIGSFEGSESLLSSFDGIGVVGCKVCLKLV